MLNRQILERMRRPRRIEEVAREHRVGLDAPELHAVTFEDDRVKLQIMTDLGNRLVFQDALELRKSIEQVDDVRGLLSGRSRSKQIVA